MKLLWEGTKFIFNSTKLYRAVAIREQPTNVFTRNYKAKLRGRSLN